MKVADLIASRRDVYFIAEDTTVHDAARYLRDKQVRAVGVCDQHGVLLGVVSQSDVSGKVAAENKCPAWMRVSEIMTRQLVSATPDTSLEDCLRLMEQHSIYHLVVLDHAKGFRGMISVTDLLQLFASDQKARADMLGSLIFPPRGKRRDFIRIAWLGSWQSPGGFRRGNTLAIQPNCRPGQL